MIDILVNCLYRAMDSIRFIYGDARMRDYVVLFINGKPVQISGASAFITLSEYLRVELNLVGTKVVCSEGDCGACSVLIGKPSEDGATFCYQCIDSCIVFMHQLDGTHVITVEGLSSPMSGALSAIQKAMVQCHGSQCGFCTPGFVMAMHGLCEHQVSPKRSFTGSDGDRSSTGSDGDIEQLSEETLRLGLSGNLCRCTGYLQIIEAGKAVDVAEFVQMNELYPPARMLDELRRVTSQSLKISHDDQMILVPRSLDEALEMKSLHPNACIVSGATDVGVWYNHGKPREKVFIGLSSVRELSNVTDRPDAIVVGAGATWAQLIDDFSVAFPEMVSILLRFGSPQIRCLGTIGGNLVNASPIADSIPFLMAIDATLNLASTKGTRAISINDFYLGYKRIDLRENELLESIECPKLTSNQKLKLYKVSKRQDMDISTFTAAILLTFESESESKDNVIIDARIAMGGVGPVVLRTRKAEKSLIGKAFSLEAMFHAGKIARQEISAITDVRGTDEYRRQLAENILLKCYYDLDLMVDKEVTAS